MCARSKQPNGTRLARVSVEMRTELMYQLTGGGPAAATNYHLDIKLSARTTQVIVDIIPRGTDIQDYGIDARYTLTDITTGKKVITGTTFSRVSFNIPGQQQRFAGERGLRDAENRAAKVIAENIRSPGVVFRRGDVLPCRFTRSGSASEP